MVVKLRLSLVRTSALLPRKPMRVTLFWYMRVSPFVEFPVVARVTQGEAWRVGPAPKCRRSAFWEGPERSLRGLLCRGSQTCCGRNRDPRGARNAKQKTECLWAPEKPRSCDQAEDGIHNGRPAPEVFVCTSAAEVRRNRSRIRVGMSAARRT
jgi:hypothetical protein